MYIPVRPFFPPPPVQSFYLFPFSHRSSSSTSCQLHVLMMASHFITVFPQSDLGIPPTPTSSFPEPGQQISFLPLLNLFAFFNFCDPSSCSTYSYIDETTLFSLAFTHPSPIGLACLLWFLVPLFSLFLLCLTLPFFLSFPSPLMSPLALGCGLVF